MSLDPTAPIIFDDGTTAFVPPRQGPVLEFTVHPDDGALAVCFDDGWIAAERVHEIGGQPPTERLQIGHHGQEVRLIVAGVRIPDDRGGSADQQRRIDDCAAVVQDGFDAHDQLSDLNQRHSRTSRLARRDRLVRPRNTIHRFRRRANQQRVSPARAVLRHPGG